MIRYETCSEVSWQGEVGIDGSLIFPVMGICVCKSEGLTQSEKNVSSWRMGSVTRGEIWDNDSAELCQKILALILSTQIFNIMYTSKCLHFEGFLIC